MEQMQLAAQLSHSVKQRNVAIVLVGVLLILNLLLTIRLLFKDTTVIVTPSVISEQYRITDRTVSKGYLEDMSRDVVQTMLNVTPSNVSYITETVLKLVHPQSYGDVKRQLMQIQEDVVTRNVSTAFYLTSIAVNEKVLSVKVEGDFHTFVGSSLTHKGTRRFEIQYDYSGAKLTIGGFREILDQ